MEVAKTVLRQGAWCTLSILALLSVSISAADAATLTHVSVHPGPVTCVHQPPPPAQPPPPVSVLTLAPTQQRQFTACKHFDNGTTQDFTPIAEWTTSDSRFARVSTTHGSFGLVTARDPGQVEIRASALLPDGRKEKGFAVLTVFAGSIVSLKTRPTTKKLEVGLPTEFSARAVYSIGAYEADVTEDCTWSSSHPAIASVVNTGEEKGLVTPLQVCGSDSTPCPVVITAHHPASGFTNGDGAITIAPEVERIAFDDDSTAVVLGQGMKTQLDVYAYRVGGSRTNISDEVEWSFSPTGLFTIGEGDDDGGVLTAIADGETTVHATDPRRGLGTSDNGGVGANVKIAGVLQSLKIEPNPPIQVGVLEERTLKALGLLSSGLTTSDLRKFVTWSIGDPSKATLLTDGDVGKVKGVAIGDTWVKAVEPVTNIASPQTTLRVRGAITSISIEPATVTVARGIDFQLNAYANRTDETRSNVNSSAVWAANPPGVIQFGTAGKIRGVANGTTTISAAVAGKSSATTGGNATVTVSGDLVSITVDQVNVPFLETRKAEAIGHTSTGAETSDLRETVEWTVVDTSIARVGPTAGPLGLEIGEVEAITSGVTTIRAREPLTGITSTEVDNLRVQGEVVAVDLEVRNNGLVPVNGVSTFKVRATLSDGAKANISEKCDWSVDDPTVASVDNVLPDKGKVTGLLFGGTSTVRVTCGLFTDSAFIQIIGDLEEVEVTPAELEGQVLREKQFRANGHYVGGFKLDITREVFWSSTNPAVAEVDEEGLVVFLAPGEALIGATATTGQSDTAEVTVVGGVEELRLLPSQATMRGSTKRFFRLLGTLDTGDQQSLGAIAEWTTSNPDVAHLSEREGDVGIVIAGPSTGIANITATLPGGLSATSQIVVNHLLVDLWMKKETATLRVGRRTQPAVRGKFSDNAEAYVGKYVELRSSDENVARVVESSGVQRIEGVAPGTAVISAFDPTTELTTSRNLTLTVTP
jgi:trimeric autotransporter adhesin